MAQIFPEWTNRIPLAAGLGGPALLVLLVAGVWYYGSPRYTDVGYMPRQPVPFSHRLHAGELDLDCRYCHASVETSSVANVPPTGTCMNCHHVIARESPKLAAVRESAKTGTPIPWVRVHDLPDFSYFDHGAHVRAGVACASCHGRVDQMEEIRQVEPLSMSWCLDCHRNPAPHLRPPSEVTEMRWVPPADQLALAERAIRERGIRPPEDCSGCHR